MKHLELTIPGRPVPWARAGRAKDGHSFTSTKQKKHRENVAWLLKEAAREKAIEKFKGPLRLEVIFTYGKRMNTRIWLNEIEPGKDLYRTSRPDIDNLQKQIMEAIEDAGVIAGEDSQISMVMASKVKG